MSEDPDKIRGERRAHFRGRSRPGRRVDVGYQRVDGLATACGKPRCEAVTANIGVGGAFLLSETPESVGSILEIALRVPDHKEELLVEAEVRWILKSSTDTEGGMGVKFAPLEVRALLILREYFSNLGKS